MFATMLWWQLMILVLVGTGCVAFAVPFLIKKGVNIKAKGVEIGNGGRQVPHDKPVTAKDVLLVVEWTTLTSRKISHMEEIQLIKEQMNYAEAQMGEVRDTLRRTYLKLLKSIKGDSTGLIQTHESHDYENIMKILTTVMIDEFRVIFRENHLVDRNELDFETYIRAKKEHFNTRITEVLNDIYPPDTKPTREELYEENIKNMAHVLDIFENVIRQGKYISVEYNKRKKDLLDELDSKVNKIIHP